MDRMQVVIVTGLSGAGKTNAVDWFEDQGYYCVDNLPPRLIGNFIELGKTSSRQIKRAAIACDVRGGEFFDDLKTTITALKRDPDIECRVLFIEAAESTLVKRYNETRRNHPLANGATTREVIIREEEKLREIRQMADTIIDTTSMKVSDFKLEMGRTFGEGGDSNFAINILSFGYKHGMAAEADIVFDVRFLPNPYYVPSLKKLTGRNKKVYNYVMRPGIAARFVQDLTGLLTELIPNYMREGKYHLNIAFGCTGGQHRSVAMAVRMSEVLAAKGYRVTLEHRDS